MTAPEATSSLAPPAVPAPSALPAAPTGRRFAAWSFGSFVVAGLAALVAVVTRPGLAPLDPCGADPRSEVARYTVERPGAHPATLSFVLAPGLRLVRLDETPGGPRATRVRVRGDGGDLEPPSATILDSSGEPRTVTVSPGDAVAVRLSVALRTTVLSAPSRGAVDGVAYVVEAEETIATPAGSFACWRVKVERKDAGTLVFWIGREGTRPVVRIHDEASGEIATLRSLERRA